MKTLFLLLFAGVIGAILATTGTLTSCSEKSKAAVLEIKSQTEDQLVGAAGEGRVAIRLMKIQYLELKERLVKIKTLKKTFSRRAEEYEKEAELLATEGNEAAASRRRSMAESYRSHIQKLTINEQEGEEHLAAFAVKYEEFKAEIQMLEEQVDSNKAIGGLTGNMDITNSFTERMETVEQLKQDLQWHLDQTESAIEVDESETNG